ncbi:MAG: hypothetical protein DRJ64_02945 [Thermoprotei archaeon]|nr:MAG: hypothetical protein DRJ64_02945 [Thermoprotei archaeon]
MDGQGPKGSAILSNSESMGHVEGRSEGTGVSLVPERVKTQTRVKGPKCGLNDEGSGNPQTAGP